MVESPERHDPIGLAGARASGEALSCSLFAEGSRQGHFFGFAFFTALLGALLCAALGKPGRSFTRVTALA